MLKSEPEGAVSVSTCDCASPEGHDLGGVWGGFWSWLSVLEQLCGRGWFGVIDSKTSEERTGGETNVSAPYQMI